MQYGSWVAVKEWTESARLHNNREDRARARECVENVGLDNDRRSV